MTSLIVASTLVDAQVSFNESLAKVRERSNSILSIPEQWGKGLLAFDGHKRPVCPHTGQLLKEWPTAQPPNFEQLQIATAIGIRTGRITSTLAFDFDGPNSWGHFKRVFGDYPWHVLPPSIAWTSGRDDRRQVGFLIEAEHQYLLDNKVRKFGDLEFRWNSAASVICGKHPYTEGYKWVEDCAPYERKIVTLPLEIIEMIPNKKIATKPTEINYKIEVNYDLVVVLEQFISLRARQLITNGSLEGHCNDDSLFVSIDLVAAENWLKVQGVGVYRSARNLYNEYINNCPDRIHGKPLDVDAMIRRFEGAKKENYATATPEETLIKRLEFHRREAKRNSLRAA